MSISNNGGEDSSVDPHSVDPRPYEPESYAFSGKIMLSAIIVLFIVVLLIVCLHIYARWYLTRVRRRHHLRRRRRRTHLVFTMDLSPTAASAFSRGLDASVLKTLPTFIYQSKSEEDSSVECAVCLSEFDEGEKGRLLPKCNHSFHTECIDMWFKSHSTCPLCRSPVEAVKETAEMVQIVVDSAAKAESTTTTSEHRTGSEAAKAQKAASSSHSSENSSSSVGSRRKAFEFGVSIEVPRRNESFKNFLEEHAQEPARSPFKSPGGRMLSFKRMLSRDRRHSQPSTPTPMTPMSSTAQEIDLEIGECEEQPVSQQVRRDTPRPRSNNIGEEQRRTTSEIVC